jgi:hypothetical protein
MARDWSPEVAIEEGIGAGNRQEDDDDLVLLRDGLVESLRRASINGIGSEGRRQD